MAAASQVPVVSPSASSTLLGDGSYFPFFARTIPSSSYQMATAVDVLLYLLNYTAVAVISSTDA